MLATTTDQDQDCRVTSLMPEPSWVVEGKKCGSMDVSSKGFSVIVTPRGSVVCVGVGAIVKDPHSTSVPDSVEVQDTSVGPVWPPLL